MPFETDNSWPPRLLNIFNYSRARNQTFENRYYGPYDKLLNYCFGDGESFTYYIAPQSPPAENSRDAVELRFRSDQQMRDGYALMLNDCPLPRLWGLSVLGTSMRVYCGDTQTLEVDPPAIPRPQPLNRVLSPSFLADGWNVDILSQDGFTQMKDIVSDIIHSNPDESQ